MALVAHVGVQGTQSDGATTSAIDTTGATLLVAGFSRQHDVTGAFTDSKGNTWTPLAIPTAGPTVRLYYAENPTVGTGHTFTIDSAFFLRGSLWVAAFSDMLTSGVFGAESGFGSDSASLSVQPGSITPSEDNMLLITALHADPGDGDTAIAAGIDSGFTVLGVIEDTPDDIGQRLAFAYQEQTTATARNPLWEWPTHNADRAAVMASFKSAGGGGGPEPAAVLSGTALDSMTEVHVREDGTREVIWTLTDTEFIPSGGGGGGGGGGEENPPFHELNFEEIADYDALLAISGWSGSSGSGPMGTKTIETEATRGKTLLYTYADRTEEVSPGICLNGGLGTAYTFPSGTVEIWMEIEAKFEDGFSTIVGDGEDCLIEGTVPQLKFVLNDMNDGERYGLFLGSNMSADEWHFEQIGDGAYNVYWSKGPFNPFDGEWHTYRFHYKIGTSGAAEVWADGEAILGVGDTTSVNPLIDQPATSFDSVQIGSTMNEGPDQVQRLWFSKIRFWRNGVGPGWSHDVH